MKIINIEDLTKRIEYQKEIIYEKASKEYESLQKEIAGLVEKLFNNESYIGIYDREYEYIKRYSIGMKEEEDGYGNAFYNEMFIDENEYNKLKIKDINDWRIQYILGNNEKYEICKKSKDLILRMILRANEKLLKLHVISYDEYLVKYNEIMKEYSKKNDFNDGELINEFDFEFDKYVLMPLKEYEERMKDKDKDELFWDTDEFSVYCFTPVEILQRNRKYKLDKLNNENNV